MTPEDLKIKEDLEKITEGTEYTLDELRWIERVDDDMETIIRKGREGRRGSRVIPSFDE